MLDAGDQKTSWGEALPVHELAFRDLGTTCLSSRTCHIEQRINLGPSLRLETKLDQVLTITQEVRSGTVDLRAIFKLIEHQRPTAPGGFDNPLAIRPECLGDDFADVRRTCKTRRPTFFLADRPLIAGFVSAFGGWEVGATEVDFDHNPESGPDDRAIFGLASIDPDRQVQQVVSQDIFTRRLFSALLLLDRSGDALANGQSLAAALDKLDAASCERYIGLNSECRILVVENHMTEHELVAHHGSSLVNETETHASLIYELLDQKPASRPVPFLRLSYLLRTGIAGPELVILTTPPKYRCPPVIGFGLQE
jgi:hypothetical protein